MKDCTDSGVNKATDIPYFEGDFWTSTMEDLIKELDTEEEDRRKFEELEAVKASDDGCFDDSIEPEEPTEVKFDLLFFQLVNYLYSRHPINVNQAVVLHIKRRISKRPLVNVELLAKI